MLETLASVAQIVGGLSVGAAVIFGAVQLRQFRQQRRDLAGAEMLHLLQNRDLREAWALVVEAGGLESVAAARAKGLEYERAAYSVVGVLEAVGFLVFRGTVPFDQVHEVSSAVVGSAWRALRGWIEDVRRQQSGERFAEWFQWLAERLEEYDRAVQVQPAHKRFASRRPWE